MTITHTAYCIQAQASYLKLKADFEAAHPDYCRTCNGHGGFHSTFNPDPGSGHGGLEDYEICGTCVDNDKCPLCGLESTLNENGDECRSCGWNAARNDQGLPEPYECECFLYPETKWEYPL